MMATLKAPLVANHETSDDQRDKMWYYIDRNGKYRGPCSVIDVVLLFFQSDVNQNTYFFKYEKNVSGVWVKMRASPELVTAVQATDLTKLKRTAYEAPLSSPRRSAPAGDKLGDTLAAAVDENGAPIVSLSTRLAEARVHATPRTKTRLRANSFNVFKKTPKYAFGKPLEAVHLTLTGVPVVLEAMRSALISRKAHLEEGIFRVSPSLVDKAATRAIVEAGNWEKLQKDDHADAASLAQLIKTWFAELPTCILEPILDHIADGACIDCEKNCELLAQLPKLNQVIMLWLIYFMKFISSHVTENKMAVRALATVWAPSLAVPPSKLGLYDQLELNEKVVDFLTTLFGCKSIGTARA